MTHNENVDPAEINKFKQHAHHWWDAAGTMKALHDINPIRLKFIRTHADLADNTLLDIGCGGGILSESLAKAGANVSGIDLCEDVIKTAKLHALESELTINYRHISSTAASEEATQYDIVTCMELLEHVPNPSELIEDCAKLVKPGGKLFFSTINRTIKAYALAVIGAEYILGMLPKGTHQYSKFIKPSELASWCRENDLELKITKGMSYNPITKEYGLCNDTNINYLMYAEKSDHA
jgi:2-polyprenyl-6-hydroxyphenyl methylase/3-demethylubiquinone-9 3-methyltransferase